MPLPRPIADALRRGATIVAATPRAARALLFRYAEDQRATGHTIWPSAPIRDWNSWLRDLWRDHAFAAPDAPMLLSNLQEQHLWTRIQRNEAAPVLSPESMAALAMEAWSLLSAHNAHATRRGTWDQPDAESFRQWAAEFDRTCTRHRWLSPSQLEATLAPLLATNVFTLPPEILLVGFDRITPAQELLLSALRSRIGVNRFEPEPQTSQRSWIAANDQRDEIAACAAWTRNLLLANPAARIGIIVPGATAVRGETDRAFRRILMPASEDILEPSNLLPWEFSLGLPLADVPALRAALLLLRWIAKPLHEEQISWLMLSGFVATTVTIHRALAAHDARQRRYGLLSPERSLAAFRESLLRYPALRPLQDQLYTFVRTIESSQVLSATRQPSAWAEIAQLLLQNIGWPGQRSSDSVQFQALSRWQRLLDEIALLDFDGTRYTWTDFIRLLEHHAAETIFAPESHDAPIRIMGPLESSGQDFDALWFLGTDDTGWPLRGRPHPLLPPTLQRQFSMPHATPEEDANLAHLVTARLLNSAPQIVFSYPERDKEAELRPSPLIASLFPAGSEPQPAAIHVAVASRTPSLEEIPDDSGILPWPIEQNAGGAHVLKSQAACPFQAFATKRLRADPLDETEWGLSPAEKGKLLHEVMRALFSHDQPGSLRTRDDIVTARDTNSLTAILDHTIDATMAAQFGSPADPWQRACLAAEKRRLTIRIGDWLKLEAERQPFTVEDCEKKLADVHIGELRLNLRADRIDRLADGTHLLLDYKTGNVTPAFWQGDRPADPQLPLYAAYGNVENLSGILFAQIRAGETGFQGRIRDAQGQLSTAIGAKTRLVTQPYSDSMRAGWARALENLAEEFLRGHADVDPQPHACDTCHLHSLCRVAQLNLVPATGADDEEEDADA